MEFHHHHSHGFLEDILESSIPYGMAMPMMNHIDDQIDQNALFQDFSLPLILDPQTLVHSSSSSSSFGQQFIHPFPDHDQQLSSVPQDHHSYTTPNIKLESSPLIDQVQDYYSVFSTLDDDVPLQNYHFVHDMGNRANQEMPDPLGFMGELEPEKRIGFNMGRNGKNCKVEGQHSKNLMAERRRRKRLNDRLSMLRSIVPKISKMDRASILGDTIDYMKELTEKINHMQQEMDISSHQLNLANAKPKEIYIRNSPKFVVERRNTDTYVQVCCTGKPELLISTISTLEALGLEIHQCVISCFNDFIMHISCSEDSEQRVILNAEDIKQALFRNAGYGGKCP